VPVFFATSEGQTRRIAQRLAAVLCALGHDSRAIDVASPQVEQVDWSSVRAAIVGASIHMQRHQSKARRFVVRHAAALNRIPSGFVSVSLSAASLNPEERAAAFRLAESFPASFAWKPAMVLSVAGRLAYTQYGFITRLLMKRIAHKEGAPTDTSRDYEFTDWEKVDIFGRALDGVMQERAARKQIVAA
jgi:menaquinone-dependent protoporphyrinogen oxidase